MTLSLSLSSQNLQRINKEKRFSDTAENADRSPDAFIIKKQTLHFTLSFKCGVFIIYLGGN